jgi:hypothetical protein
MPPVTGYATATQAERSGYPAGVGGSFSRWNPRQPRCGGSPPRDRPPALEAARGQHVDEQGEVSGRGPLQQGHALVGEAGIDGAHVALTVARST